MTLTKQLPYAETLNFWKSGQSSPDTWIDKTAKTVRALNGKTNGHAFGTDDNGRAAFMFAFEVEGEKFKIIWPVLRSKTGDERAARIQAATSLHHYVKSVCLYAAVVGFRAAFFSHLMLPDGRLASEVANPELVAMVPRMMIGDGK